MTLPASVGYQAGGVRRQMMARDYRLRSSGSGWRPLLLPPVRG